MKRHLLDTPQATAWQWNIYHFSHVLPVEDESSNAMVLHLGRLKWNLKITQLKKEKSSSKSPFLFGFHVNFPRVYRCTCKNHQSFLHCPRKKTWLANRQPPGMDKTASMPMKHKWGNQSSEFLGRFQSCYC